MNWLEFFGITPQQLTPLLIAGGIFAWGAWKYFLKGLNIEVIDLHHATKELQRKLEEICDGWKPQHGLDKSPIFSYGSAGSPMTPTKKGETLLEESGFNKKVYPELQKEIFTIMDGKGLRTLYDFEKGAEDTLNELKNNPTMDCLKEYSVNHPNESLELIFKVGSWLIRDKYAEHKEIKVDHKKDDQK